MNATESQTCLLNERLIKAKQFRWIPRFVISVGAFALIWQFEILCYSKRETDEDFSCSGAGSQANSHEMNAVGVMHQRAGKLDQARKCYLSAIRKRKSFVTPIFNLGTLDMALGKTNDAVGQFRRVLSLQPTYASAYYNMGTAFIELGQLPLAVTHLRHAVALDPNYVSAHANLATALHMQVRRSAAPFRLLSPFASCGLLRPQRARTPLARPAPAQPTRPPPPPRRRATPPRGAARPPPRARRRRAGGRATWRGRSSTTRRASGSRRASPTGG
jgi:tetratricopeptide (TPR) repeat protein